MYVSLILDIIQDWKYVKDENGKIIPSSEASYEFAANKLLNREEGFWKSHSMQSNIWVKFEFQGDKIVDGIKIKTPEDSNKIKDFEFQYHDGVDWKTIHIGSSDTCCVWLENTFSNVRSRLFRLKIISTWGEKNIATIQAIQLHFIKGKVFIRPKIRITMIYNVYYPFLEASRFHKTRIVKSTHFMDEYLAWKKGLRKEDLSSIKNVLSELQALEFAYISSMIKPPDYQPNSKIGSFIHYGYVQAIKDGFLTNNAHSIMAKILMSKNVDLLLLMKTLTLNEFQSLDKGSKISNFLTNCLEEEKAAYIEMENSANSDTMMKGKSYFKKSPCMDSERKSTCDEFCSWFSNATKLIPKEIRLAIIRYYFSSFSSLKVSFHLNF